MKVMVSGLVNVETTLKIKEFPIPYFPIDYPFFGIHSDVSGVAFNVAKALMALGNEVRLTALIGNDEEGKRILKKLEKEKIGTEFIRKELEETPVTVTLYDPEGKRQIYCDLKDVQERVLDFTDLEEDIKDSDLVVLCNTNFNRSLLKKVKAMGKLIASDVHVLGDLKDAFNKDFMEYADILFLSDEQLPCEPRRFLLKMKEKYLPKIIVMGMGKEGALLYVRAEDRIYKLGAARVGEVVNTLGAGDALFSAFINYYGKGYAPVEALSRAEVFAALKIRCSGGAKGFVEEGTVEDYYQNSGIVVEEVVMEL